VIRATLLAAAAALLLTVGIQSGAEPPTEGAAVRLASAIRNAGLDPNACYRVRELAFSREDIRFYLTDGYLIFGNPVEGHIYSAVFLAAPETGDAEVIVLPPDRSERASLARHINSPSLNEHFGTAVFLFSDNSARELMEHLRAAAAPLELEKGVLIAGSFASVVRNLTGSLDLRMVHDHLTGSAERGLFYAAVTGNTIGNFDLIFDPQAHQQITAGQLATRDNRTYFDVFTSFTGRSWRAGRLQPHQSGLRVSDFRITADLQPDLHMKVTTRLKLTASRETRGAVPFELSRRMRVTCARTPSGATRTQFCSWSFPSPSRPAGITRLKSSTKVPSSLPRATASISSVRARTGTPISGSIFPRMI
jgi:hypothetical protein